MVSDVPLGAFVSGGVDSSIVVGLMAEASSRPVKTFSIGFDEPQFDELEHARRVADHFRTDHHEFVVRPDGLAILDRLIEHFDEPFADSSTIPTWYVSEIARQHVTVALGGDGGDELFAGYDTFTAIDAARVGRALLPRAADPALHFAVRYLPSQSAKSRFPLEFKARRFLRGWRARGLSRNSTKTPMRR